MALPQVAPGIAVVGMACRFPDADSPARLWENVLAQRRAFRILPPERLRAEDYFSPDRDTPDATYSVQAAVLHDYEFDRQRFRVGGTAFRSADMTHWLALDVAARALADAGFEDGRGLPREMTGVVLANTLTGEFSRAGLMRHRWPYVRRHVASALGDRGWADDAVAEFLRILEERYKAPFPPVGEESLAGGLSNTIAGRICNHFDLKGGGYTVDGACASSLLAVTQACSALAAGDLDIALAGGVDLSLDPFELVGFAKAGALAAREMRIYDAHSGGFWPGEGSGFVVLMRMEDAMARRARVYALVRGWGISSDGTGGITRPEEDGQILALQRAYRRAGFGPNAPGYFEGHGTGTAVGDLTELKVLARARREAGPGAVPAALGSVKANIGHAKAAAGIAGFIKATCSVHRRILPPTTGCPDPHPELLRPDAPLRILRQPESWPDEGPRRAGVSSMGFGGINAHVVIESPDGTRPVPIPRRVQSIARTPQDAELFLFTASSVSELIGRLDAIAACAPRLSLGELTDLAGHLAFRVHEEAEIAPPGIRAAILAARPSELAEALAALRHRLDQGATEVFDLPDVFLSARTARPRVGFLFPGQASPDHADGGAMGRRFEVVAELYRDRPEATAARSDTAVSQPAIVRATLAGLRLAGLFGIEAVAGCGHSLGELVALAWAGAWDDATALAVASFRGHAMSTLGEPGGAMAALEASAETVADWLHDLPVVVAGRNAPDQTVVSGPAKAIDDLLRTSFRHGVKGTRLAVSHAFHSPGMAAAAAALERRWTGLEFRRLQRTVVSTVTGAPLDATAEIGSLLVRQLQSPVRFIEAAREIGTRCDVLFEVGPGNVLARLAPRTLGFAGPPAFPFDACGPTLRPFLGALGVAFALGVPVRTAELFRGRLVRPFKLPWSARFLANPCEQAPRPDATATSVASPAPAGSESPAIPAPAPRTSPGDSALDIVRSLVARRTELALESIHASHRLLGDLHLNSISVGQLVADAAQRLGLRPPSNPTEFASATVGDVAEALEATRETVAATGAPPADRYPDGVDNWVASFAVEWVPAPPLPDPRPTGNNETDWKVFAAADLQPAAALAQRLRVGSPEIPRGATPRPVGAVVWLPDGGAEQGVPLLLDAARTVLDRPGNGRFVVVHSGGGAAGFARTLHLEASRIDVLVLQFDPGVDLANLVDRIASELQAVTGYRETRIGSDGLRWRPRLRPWAGTGEAEAPGLKPGDVLLVTGGGKGIAAECALALGRRWGVRLLLVGRSLPESDAALASNLARFAADGLTTRYLAADVADAEAVLRAIAIGERELGPITGFLHGAGTNVPRLVPQLDVAAFRHTLAPKLDGFRNVLAAVRPERLRLVVTFSSIIGRGGLPGEADYAFANAELTRLTELFQRRHPMCRCLALEWSVWSGVGMGERLGRIDTLRDQGISPIAPLEGVTLLERLAAQPAGPVAQVVSGRFGGLPTLPMDRPELPFLRFLEEPRIHYPGIELVVEARLSVDSDPLVVDHVLRGERLFPAVLGLEAMTQVAQALMESTDKPDFHDVELRRPVVVPATGSTSIRVAALRRGSHGVEVVLRCASTGFQTDHFRCRCEFPDVRRPGAALAGPGLPSLLPPEPNGHSTDGDPVDIDVERHIYEPLLFHTGRFRRIATYDRFRTRQGVAVLRPSADLPWFGPYHPQELRLGDPGARDAGIHAIQAGLPHLRLLPVSVETIRFARCASGNTNAARVRYVERGLSGNTFTYDLEFVASNGNVTEVWVGLRLTAIEPIPAPRAWSPALFGAYVERQLEASFGYARLAVGLVAGRSAAPERAAHALCHLSGQALRVEHRPDGSLEVLASGPDKARRLACAVAHHGNLTLAVLGGEELGAVGADLEATESRTETQWIGLLGTAGMQLARRIADAASDDLEAAATRIWCAREALTKQGCRTDAPLVFDALGEPGWVHLRSGSTRVSTCRARLDGRPLPVVLAVSGPRPEDAER